MKPSGNMSTAQQLEADFHDQRLINDDGHRLSLVYEAVADVYDFTALRPAEQSLNILELGCFDGERARKTALKGFTGHYIGVDISPQAVKVCRGLGLGDQFEFLVDDANTLSGVADHSIDLVLGDGVLHHLQLPQFCQAMERVLRPGGKGRFVEPAQGNLMIRAFRRLTPWLRTPDEHPFDAKDLGLLRASFLTHVQHQALMRPLLPLLCGNAAWAVRGSKRLDDWLLRSSLLQSQAWILQLQITHGRS
jgi:SAM-dependent methyltransferase